ncbi:MAG: DNA/RNA non-specific endonuclease [Bacteroidales bacterium]|jgi:endonuclease G|nr:DNA/RNA non-specific endonuclease [Bacteroidales bacterium]MBR3485368.1 DNA/RNA non-specific endonuclease [Bacteroidales bacterium]MBR6868642.1 DNA/RNA non-specific endonuclease [Bacteroidales bacterium]MCR5744880.1 DNA/RNA non-specific endonuclease [Bacteroidales bacterium]
MKKLLPKLLALVLVLAGAVLYYVFDHRSVEPDDPDAPVVNPGRVSTDIPLNVASLMEVPDLTESYSPIVPHKAYVSSYNEETLIPDWVAYELTADETGGTESRGGIEFRMDPTLRGVTQAMREDYSGSGWTKGHLMPAADAAYSTTTMGETFYFTNICPQDETLNAGDWAYLEKRVRQWANRYGHIWVVTGPIVGENRYGTIGEREVVVPDSFFKALLIQKKNGSYSAIAFVMDNDDERYYLKDCYLTVDELETLTGFNFFPQLDDTIEEKVESKVRLSDWGIR